MECLNLIILRGIVGQVRITPIGDLQCVRFSMCTNYAYNQTDGTPVYETTWHNVTVFTDSDAKKDAAKLKKGDKVEVRGRLRMQRYTGAYGEQKVAPDIYAQKVVLFDNDEPMKAVMDL